MRYLPRRPCLPRTGDGESERCFTPPPLLLLVVLPVSLASPLKCPASTPPPASSRARGAGPLLLWLFWLLLREALALSNELQSPTDHRRRRRCRPPRRSDPVDLLPRESADAGDDDVDDRWRWWWWWLYRSARCRTVSEGERCGRR